MATTMALMKPKSTEASTKLEPWIETFTGKKFYFLNPTLEQIDIRDIAHSLAFTCRYTGHSNRFYSVAEHSILVSYLAADPLAGLLHDASEAYITDIASPIKPYLNNYKDLEDMLMGRIATCFGFTYPLDADIKDCDATQLKTEAKHLLKSRGEPWAHMYPTRRAHGITPQCMSPEEAEKAFLNRFEEVRNVAFTSYEYNDETSDFVWRSTPDKHIYGNQDVAVRSGSLRGKDSGGQDHHCGEDSRDRQKGLRSGTESRGKSEKAVGD